LSDLKQRGTPESLAALEKISAESSEHEKKLHWILIEAKENVRRHTWKPMTPAAFLDLLKQQTPQASSSETATMRAMRAALSDEEMEKLIWNGNLVADIPALLDFLKIYRDRPEDVVFFVGAGLSRPLFPSWGAALERLVTQTSKRLGYTDRDADLRRMLNEGKSF
jgi:hypothetical protein